MATTAPDALSAHRELVAKAFDSALGRLHPRLALVARYHHGDVEADGLPTTARGKALRPALALLCATAVGGSTDDALPGAVAVELVHDFSLLHDDVMDGDTSRRHRPTAWTVFGTGAAILAGDALLALADGLVGEVAGARGIGARALLNAAVLRLVAGQMDDLDFERRLDVRFDDYLAMAGGKTAALLSCSCALGATLSGAPAPTVEGLAEFGEHLGLAFQLVDDLLGIWGDPARTGKPVLGDITARKKSAPVVAALASGGPGLAELQDHLAGTGTNLEEAGLRRLARVIEECGGRAETEREVQRQLTLASRSLESLDLDRQSTGALLAIADYVTTRDR